MIRIAFPGFEGTPEALREALRRGRLSPKEVPVLAVLEQALAQVPEDLRAKSELLPLLAELLVLKLSPERALLPKEEGEEAPLVQVLVDLSEMVAFLGPAWSGGRGFSPWPRPPAQARPEAFPKVLGRGGEGLPQGRSPASPGGLRGAGGLGAAQGGDPGPGGLPEPAACHLGREGGGLRRPPRTFRLGRVRLFQEAPFAPLYVEPVGLLEGDLERTA